MAALEVLFDPILPVSFILAVGFVMGRMGWVAEAEARAINRLAMTVFIPLLVGGLIAAAPVEDFSAPGIGWYFVTEVVLFGAGYILATRVLKRERGEAVLLAFCGVFANTVFFTLPMGILLYGKDQIVPITAVLTLDSAVAFCAVMFALQLIRLGRASPGAILRTLVRTPVLVAVAVGTAVNLSGLPVPAAVDTFIHFNGAAAPPIALFALGVILSRTSFRFDPAVLIFSAVKLLAFPLMVFAGIAALMPQQADLRQFVLASAGPSGAMGFSMALLYGIRTDAIAQIIILTSALSILVLAVLA